MTHVAFFARETLFVVFVAAVVGKVHSRAAWASFVEATADLLHINYGQTPLAAAVVIVEISTVVCLSLNQATQAGLVLALAVFTVFLIIVISGVTHGVRTACNCFGTAGNILGWTHVWRNAALTCLAAVGSVAAATSGVPSAFAGASYATPAVLAVIVAALFVMWDDFNDLVLGPEH